MEEILQYGIWKDRLPFYSIACHANVCDCEYCTFQNRDKKLYCIFIFGYQSEHFRLYLGIG